MIENKRFINHGSMIFENKPPLRETLSSFEIVDLLNELYEENVELKKENYKLHKRLGDFEPFEEYIKERTSKISVNDISGLVKTDEPTNSVELKKELKE